MPELAPCYGVMSIDAIYQDVFNRRRGGNSFNDLNGECEMISTTTLAPVKLAQNAELAENVSTAITEAKVLGGFFVLQWRSFADAYRPYNHEENECGCGCSPVD